MPVTDDHAVNAIDDSPIWYALFIKKSEDVVAVMVLFEREKLGAYDGIAKKSDADLMQTRAVHKISNLHCFLS